jgi:uncharacterized protein (TIRG00374 family)
MLLRQCRCESSLARTVRLILVGQLGNTLLPARLGDGARAVFLGPRTKGGIASVVATIVAEKALDGIAGLVALVVLAAWTPLPAWMRGPIVGTAALTALLLALVLLGRRRALSSRIAMTVVTWLPAGLRSAAASALSNLTEAFRLLGQRSVALQALLWTLLVWGLGALTNAVVLAALHIQAPVWSIFLVLTVGYAASFLPTAPAQIGVFEYACVLSLTAAGLRPEEALAFGLVLHVLVLAPAALLGPIAMAFEGLGWSQLRASRHG